MGLLISPRLRSIHEPILQLLLEDRFPRADPDAVGARAIATRPSQVSPVGEEYG
jgi:hypothetical protein